MTEQVESQRESGFKIAHIALLESHFKRETIITLDDNAVKKDASINVEVNINNENILYVTESFELKHTKDDIVEIIASIRILGIFEKVGESPLSLEDFGHVNGAAIIYPYIREHLMSLSTKAGLSPIILPPLNFTRKKQ